MKLRDLANRLGWPPVSVQGRPNSLRLTLDLTPAQIVAIQNLVNAARRRAGEDADIQPRAVAAARGVLTLDQRLKLDQLAAASKDDPIVEEATRYNLIHSG